MTSNGQEHDPQMLDHFERWWKQHPLHRRAEHDPAVKPLMPLFEDIAKSAWLGALGFVPKGMRDTRLERLEERAQSLRNAIFNARPQPMHHAKAELSALEWAIQLIRAVVGDQK